MVSEREDVQGAPVRVALIGCGVVGSAVARLLIEHADDLAARVGRPLELVGIGVRRPGRNRGDGLDPALFTTDSADLVTRADVVIEVVGGIEPARTLILRAMAHGASVVTANKALLAEDGPTLYAAAAEHGVDLYFEAAVAGGIPLLRPLRESLAGDSVRKVMGIVNGTTNYVLDKMDTTGQGFADAVSQAQALGYAEADPTADVEGFDAAAKAAILASLAFHTRVDRAKDLIIVSGFNVFPAEVEEIICEMPGVAECAVVGVPHPHTGESVKAFVVPAPGYALEEDAVIEHCADQLARYKCPQKVNFVDALPQNLSGKVLRRALR